MVAPVRLTNVPARMGWQHLAAAVADRIPPAEVDGVWTFPTLRQAQREWGTAVVSRVDGDRRRIYTARFVHQVKGKERGRFEATIEEVGSGPVEALAELLQDVHKRTDDEQPLTPVPPADWFASADGPTQPR